MGDSHVDGALLDNVAESGEDSEDEWNYFKGEGEQEKQNPSQDHEEPPLSQTPCQDNVSISLKIKISDFFYFPFYFI